MKGFSPINLCPELMLQMGRTKIEKHGELSRSQSNRLPNWEPASLESGAQQVVSLGHWEGEPSVKWRMEWGKQIQQHICKCGGPFGTFTYKALKGMNRLYFLRSKDRPDPGWPWSVRTLGNKLHTSDLSVCTCQLLSLLKGQLPPR